MTSHVALLGTLTTLLGCASPYVDDQLHPTLETAEIHAIHQAPQGQPGTFVDRLIVVVDYENGVEPRKLKSFSVRVTDPQQPDAPEDFALASSPVSFAPHERRL